MAEEAKWYVAHTYSGYENKVKEDLEKTVENRGLQDMILEISYPTEEVVEMKDGKRKVVTRKMLRYDQDDYERQNLVHCAQHPRRYGLRRPGIKARAPYR